MTPEQKDILQQIAYTSTQMDHHVESLAAYKKQLDELTLNLVQSVFADTPPQHPEKKT